MKLHLSQPEGLNQITSCGSNHVVVNGIRHDHSLLLTPNALVADWPVANLESLTHSHLVAALELKPELVLLGTGATLRFPTGAVLQPIVDANIGFEVMDTGAACRTYNILMAEGRQVLAALIVG